MLAVVVIQLCFTVMVRSALPDFSHDRYTEDIWDASSSKYIYEVRYDNEDRPRHCRVDICQADRTNNTPKGSFFWPDTQLETRLFVRCPYAVHTPVYAHRDCIFSSEAYNNTISPGINNSYSEWDAPVFQHCPDPPLEELLEELLDEEKTFKPIPPIAWYAEVIDRISHTMTSYGDTPVRYRDILDVASLLTRAVLSILPAAQPFPRSTVRNGLEAFNELLKLDSERNVLLGRVKHDNNRLLEALTLLTEMWTPAEHELQSSLDFAWFSVVAIRAEHQVNYSNSFFDTALAITVKDQGSTLDILHILCLGYRLFTPQLTFESDDQLTLSSPMTPPWSPHFGHSSREYEMKGPIFYVSISRYQGERNDKLQFWQSIDRDVSVKTTTSLNTESFSTSCGGIDIDRHFMWNISNYNGMTWYDLDCEEITTFTHVQCDCSHMGFHALFAADRVDTPLPSQTHAGRFTTTITTFTVPIQGSSGSTFSEFLGFPYNYELYIAGQVMRAISIVCLVMTIVGHVALRKGPLSVPTRILLHLSVSLILLNLTLYVAEAVGGTRWGCRMSNIFRYYLVMVSLGWNVTEAVNLYLMLVKVFKSHIRHFVLKAAFLAWGLPLLPIIIVLSANERGFDGKYFNDCTQKCVLKDPVFYFAYMLPLGIIVVGNSVIFILVIRVLRSHRTGVLPDSRRSSGLKQLLGAVSMMFLLGIPWVFSAFGAINVHHENDSTPLLTGILQVIAVVFLSLQGFFIFIFHCVKNSDVRTKWRAALSSWKQDDSAVSSARKSSDNRKHSANQGNQHELSNSSKTQSTQLTSNSELYIQGTPL